MSAQRDPQYNLIRIGRLYTGFISTPLTQDSRIFDRRFQNSTGSVRQRTFQNEPPDAVLRMHHVKHHFVPQRFVGIQNLPHHILPGRLWREGQCVLQGIFQTAYAVMRWHFLFRGRRLLFIDVDRRFLLNTQCFSKIISGELVAVVQKHAAAEHENRLSDEEIFRLVVFRDFRVGALQIYGGKGHRSVGPYLLGYFSKLKRKWLSLYFHNTI